MAITVFARLISIHYTEQAQKQKKKPKPDIMTRRKNFQLVGPTPWTQWQNFGFEDRTQSNKWLAYISGTSVKNTVITFGPTFETVEYW